MGLAHRSWALGAQLAPVWERGSIPVRSALGDRGLLSRIGGTSILLLKSGGAETHLVFRHGRYQHHAVCGMRNGMALEVGGTKSQGTWEEGAEEGGKGAGGTVREGRGREARWSGGSAWCKAEGGVPNRSAQAGEERQRRPGVSAKRGPAKSAISSRGPGVLERFGTDAGGGAGWSRTSGRVAIHGRS